MVERRLEAEGPDRAGMESLGTQDDPVGVALEVGAQGGGRVDADPVKRGEARRAGIVAEQAGVAGTGKS